MAENEINPYAQFSEKAQDKTNPYAQFSKVEEPQGLVLETAPRKGFFDETYQQTIGRVIEGWNEIHGGKEVEGARIVNAIRMSYMLNIPASTAYEYHDEIQDQLNTKMGGEKIVTSKVGLGKAIESGLKSSLIGAILTKTAPEPFESVDQRERWIYGLLSYAPDLPVFAIGQLLGGGPETPAGWAGGFALDAGLRKILIDDYKKGAATSFSEMCNRMGAAILEAVKGGVIGYATGGVGGLASKVGFKALAECATMTTVGKLVEGEIPSVQDFKDNMAMYVALGLGSRGLRGTRQLMNIYKKFGIHPADIIRAAQAKIPVAEYTRPGLRPVIKEGDKVTTGNEGETHLDVIEKTEGMREKETSPIGSGIESWEDYPKMAIGKEPKAENIVSETENTFGFKEVLSEQKKGNEKLTVINLFDKEGNNVGGISRHVGISGKPTIREVYLSPELRGKGLYAYLREKFPDAEPTGEAATVAATKAREKYAKGKEEGKVVQESERGFSPDGKTFLPREEAKVWVKENDPETYAIWEAKNGAEAEFHSQDYNEARAKAAAHHAEAGFLDLSPALKLIRKALDMIREGKGSNKYGEMLRTYFTGERDFRVVKTNQLRDELAKLIPDYKDQEALSFMRDYKGKEGILRKEREEIANGDNGTLKKLIPVIDRALNPTAKLLEADKKVTQYFKECLDEGKKLGILDSSITPEQYITHLLEPDVVTKRGRSGFGRGRISRFTPFAKGRKYETILDAIKDPDIKAKTLNALDALSVYGDRHATAVATKLLINELKTTEMGKWGYRRAENIPKDWVELAPGSDLFRNHVPYIDPETGKPVVATQNLYVPQIVADALAPIVDPASIANIPGFRTGRLYQFYIKSAELSLSLFHLVALNLAALGNEGFTGVIKGYRADLESLTFKTAEARWAKAGLMTTMQGRTVEVYHAMQKKTFPTRMDVIRDLPGFKQIDQLAQAITHEIFDIAQRKFKVTDASIQEAAWIAKNPNATNVGHLTAQRAIAKTVNAVYGGLHWENLGMNRNSLELSRALLLAPDWTFSNLLHLKYAGEGGPGGAAARKFWIRSFSFGMAFTQCMSLAITGKMSSKPTQVYLGKDDQGREVYTNLFFYGAPKDLITFIDNVSEYGAIVGLSRTVASKLGPLARATEGLLSNRDWMGREIIKRGEGPIKGTAKSVVELASALAPVPFSVSSTTRMLLDGEEHDIWDYSTMLIGTRTQHVLPGGVKPRKFKQGFSIRSTE